MKLVFNLFIVLILSLGAVTAQEQFKAHWVEKGETVYSIAKKYNISEELIYKLNPDAKNGIQEKTLLIIPVDQVVVEDDEVTQFTMHKVKRKETLFSLSQLYNIQVSDIKKYNKELYSRDLNKGEIIRIPQGIKKDVVNIEEPIDSNISSEAAVHVVLPKETKYGIARKYGISIAELEDLNPNIIENLKEGDVLIVPEESVVESTTIDEGKYDFYEVQPKEGFYRLQVKFGISESEIVALNPYAKDGLKEGMILKIPKEPIIGESENVATINLENDIRYRSEKNIALMLPFRIDRIESDSIEVKKEMLRNDATLRVALDFYSGVLLAAEFAKDHGISSYIKVFDTEASEQRVSGLVASNNFENFDAIIGPLLRKNVEKLASEIHDTPIFSPLSNADIKKAPNVFQTLPTEEMLQDKMLKYLKEHYYGKNVVLISDAKKNASKNLVLLTLENVQILEPREKGFLKRSDIYVKLDKTRENWMILESTDPILVSSVIGLLNGIPGEYKIRLFTLDKNTAFDYNEVSNLYLANLQFTFPSVNKSYNYNDKNAFLTSYKNTYGVLPNRYAVRGFDLTYDILLRLATDPDLFASNPEEETAYIENKFRYSNKANLGYQNNALYIIKLNMDLQYEEVK